MSTASDLTIGAYGALGAYDKNQGLQPEEAELGLDKLNTILDAWYLERLYAFTVDEVVVTLPPATRTRTIGPGMQIDIARPIRIEAGGFTRSSGVDYPLEVATFEQYSEITFKSIGSTWPEVVYFDGSFPTGTLYFYPQTAGSLELHLPVMHRLTQFANLTTDYSLPPGYKKALIYTLAEELAPDLGMPAPPSVMRIAAMSRKSIKRANVSVPKLSTERTGPRRFNILGNR